MGAIPNEMTTGPGGTVWFTDDGGGTAPIPAIGRITSDGVIKEFTYPNPMPQFESITPGDDGNVWVTDRGQHPAVAKITPDGTITPYTIGAAPNQMPDGLTPGPDNKMWFTDEGSPAAIGTVPENGPAAEPATEGNNGMQAGSRPDSIIAGSDGRLWFADQYSTSPKLGAVTPAGTIVTEYPLGGVPQGIALGIDGNVWVTQHQVGAEAVVRVKPDGTANAFTDGLPATADLTEEDIVSGPDGNLWFVDRGTNRIGRADVQLAPTATTGAASSIGALTATVTGSVNPRGAPTTVSVEYGGSSVLGSKMSAGTLTASPTASPVTAALSALPAGSTVFYRVVATNAYGTATGAIQTFKTAAAKPIVIPPKPTATTTTTTTTVGDHRITLVTPSPSACTARSKSLAIKLTASGIRGSRAAKVRFVSASLFLDRGVKHIRHRTKRSHGKKIRVKVTVFTANKVVRKLPAQPSLRLGGLRAGRHSLNVKLLFRKGKKTPVRKTMRVHFRVC